MASPKLKHLLRILSALLCTGLVVSCNSVDIKNARIYADQGVLGSTYAETLTTQTGDIPQPDWDNQRFGMLCMSSDDFTNFKTEIEQLCHLNGSNCTYQMQQQIADFFSKIDAMEANLHGVQ